MSFKNKYKNIYAIAAVFAVLLVVMLVTYNADTISNYPRYTISAADFVNDDAHNRIAGLSLEDGKMTVTEALSFVVIGDRKILDKPLKSVTVNVSSLDAPVKNAKLYVLDTYQRYDFELKEGANSIILPNGNILNDGIAPALLRFDLLDTIGESAVIDSIVFNEPSVCGPELVERNLESVGGGFAAIAGAAMCCYMLLLGLTRLRVKGLDVVFTIAGVVLSGGAYYITGKSLVTVLLCTISIIRIIWHIYYLFSSLANRLIKSKKMLFSLAIIYMLALLAMLMYNTAVFLLLVWYPLYAFGYFYSLINPQVNSKKAVPSMLASLVAIGLILNKMAGFRGCLNALNGSAVRADLLMFTLLLYVFALSLMLVYKSIREFINKVDLQLLAIALPYPIAVAVAVGFDINITQLEAILTLVMAAAIGLIFAHKNSKAAAITAPDDAAGLKLGNIILSIAILQILFMLALLGYEAMVRLMLIGENIYDVKLYLSGFLFSPVFVYNMLFANSLYLVFAGIFGKGLGRLFYTVGAFLLFLANFVKLKYHNAMFKPGDFLQIGDFLKIVNEAVRFRHIVVIVLMVLAIGFVLYKLRRHLKPRFKPVLVLASCLMLFAVCKYTSDNRLSDIGITMVDRWLSDELRTERQGFLIYTYYNALGIKDLLPQMPQEYNEKSMNNLAIEFNSLDSRSAGEDTMPDVIMLMLESAFDIEGVDGLSFNMELEQNIKTYKTADLISPMYGGGTANIEFEALTGFSTFFIANNVIPYTTYWSSEDAIIPSVAHQFKENGYKTVALHPNDEDFYNRRIVYKAMGFDDFISIEDMAEDVARNRRSYVYNTETLKYMLDELERDDQPTFMFALNIENHNPYDIKEADAKVEVSADNISEGEKNEVEVYAETLNNDDKMIGEVIDYINNTDRPTLLYVWGDHLPALGVLSSTGYITQPQNKYKTPIIMYSNYKQLNADSEALTPNQLAAQAVRDAGIKYDTYFDYIYSLRGSYPVVHREFGVDMNAAELKKYELLQYDLLFGKRYLWDYNANT